MAGNTRQTGASVTGRALAILGAFDLAHRDLSLSEIARRTGLPLATVHRLLAELETWGALDRGSDGRYSVGLRLWELGTLTPARARLREAALPHLQMLYEVVREPVHLVVADGSDSVCVEYLAGPSAVPPPGPVGLRLPLEESAAGLVLLAHRAPPGAPGEPSPLWRQLAEVRRRRYADRVDGLSGARRSIAVPVAAGDGTAAAAVGLSVPTASEAGRRCLPALLATAGSVRRALAAAGGPEETAVPAVAFAGGTGAGAVRRARPSVRAVGSADASAGPGAVGGEATAAAARRASA